ncbi:MAG: type II secretion system F family protein [Betaproteobacteria bacterium]|nr:MAG: type II secretion system F family protein [Betaproteobacteria bacterium]
MPSFAYTGRDPRGELIQGRMEGADSGAVADQLLNTGITPVDIKPSPAAGAPAAAVSGVLRKRFGQPITLVDLMLFSRQMYTLLKAGVPIMRALAGLEESVINPSLKTVIADLRKSLDSGRELSAALRRHPDLFSSFYIGLVRVGESTGMLETVFLRLYEHLEFEKEIRERIKSAMRYPMFVVAAMVIALIVINIVVIPAFAKLFHGFNAPLPLMTRILIGASDFTVQFWPVIVAAVALAAVGFRMWKKTPRGKYAWDKLKLKLPIAGKIMNKATLARFARSLALSLRSGVPVVQGLTSVAAVVDNDYLAARIEGMRESVERGESVLRTAADAGIFTPVVLQMIAVGAETGELDELMLEVAQLYEREVDYEVKTLAAQIEPVLIVFLGVIVLILALGVFLPIWDLSRVALRR